MPPAHQLPFERPVYELEDQLARLESQPDQSANIREAIRNLRVEIRRKTREIYDGLDPWQIVQVSRHQERPQTLDYIELVFDEFVELHGDRAYSDDRAILTGFARLEDRKVMFVGQHKGRNLQERNEHNYGMANPEGYRKAMVRMEMASRYGIPIICFIDTPGAYPGVGAEERGQAYNIAVNLREMATLKSPVIGVVIGEGGSGGALGISIADHMAVLQFAYYSVISPEGCASILWKTSERASDAAEALGITAHRLKALGLVDKIVNEPVGGAHRDHAQMAAFLKRALNDAWRQVADLKVKELLERRHARLDGYGRFTDTKADSKSDRR
ncbi:MAG: acetyl-CoA carboxylase carboxyltransferase subunit alpha [Hydrogenophaga sp.]|nr:acetyl-CoA carboxylase carboxyltransferase subunit alpha [Hydrogenophaga sp.]